MPDEPHNYHLNAEASDELHAQGERAKLILEKLAADLAAHDPNRPRHLRDLVEKPHVLAAADILFGANGTRARPRSAASARLVFISHSAEDQEFVDELASDIARAGLRCFVAKRSIRGAGVWTEAIL